MTIEDDRAAMHAEVDGITADDTTLTAVRGRVRRRRTTRAVGGSLLAVAAIAGSVFGIATFMDDGPGQRVIVVPPATSPTTVEEPVDDAAFPGLWPFASMAEVDAYEADPGVGMFFDADTTALEFARVYLGMADPAVVEPIGTGEGDTRFVHLTPKPGAPMVTTVWVHPFGDEGAYSVYDVVTDNIQLEWGDDVPIAGTTITVSGTSTAYEATVYVEVREDGQVAGERIGDTFVMGGTMGEMAPFIGDVSFDRPTTPGGAILLLTYSAEDGTVQEARVKRLQFHDPNPSDVLQPFSVFFHRGEERVEVRRNIEPTPAILRAALDALVAGPLPQDGDGIDSLFSEETRAILAGVNLTDDGTAIIDLASTVNNASTSAGSVAFLDELNATVFQFETVERIEYRLQGSCEAFWSWQQRGDGCDLVTRGDWSR